MKTISRLDWKTIVAGSILFGLGKITLELHALNAKADAAIARAQAPCVLVVDSNARAQLTGAMADAIIATSPAE